MSLLNNAKLLLNDDKISSDSILPFREISIAIGVISHQMVSATFQTPDAAISLA